MRVLPATSSLLPAIAVLVSACGTDLPRGTEHFTVGRTTVRTDSQLDYLGVIHRVADTSRVPPRGPVRHWMQALATERSAGVFAAARAVGPLPVGPLLETWAAPDAPDSACGLVAPGERRCFRGNEPMRRLIRAFIDSSAAFVPRLATFGLEGLSADERRRDLADVYVALTTGKSLDSAVGAWSGYHDLRFDVTLARTLATAGTAPNVDPARPTGAARRIFLTPDVVFATRSYRSPTYIWLALGHQMAHAVAARLLAEHPELLDHGWRLKEALEPEMARIGYEPVFWNEMLEEQLARAFTISIVGTVNPTVTWAARSEAMLSTGMPLVPWFEDVLARYDAHRDSFPDIGALAPALARALDSIPLDSCRGAPNAGAILVGVDRGRAVLSWMAPGSPFRRTNILIGDTVTAIDGEAVSAGGLLLPTRQIAYAWAHHLPFELGVLDIRRGGREYQVRAPVTFDVRRMVRVASQAAGAPADTIPICRWNRRALRR